MQTIRTSDQLRKSDARRLMKGGFEIEYIETMHLDAGDKTTIVWRGPMLPFGLREEDLPY